MTPDRQALASLARLCHTVSCRCLLSVYVCHVLSYRRCLLSVYVCHVVSYSRCLLSVYVCHVLSYRRCLLSVKELLLALHETVWEEVLGLQICYRKFLNTLYLAVCMSLNCIIIL